MSRRTLPGMIRRATADRTDERDQHAVSAPMSATSTLPARR
jgi:hypothetical protein